MSSRDGSSNDGGVRQPRGVLIAAGAVALVGLAFPLVLAGEQAVRAAPYALTGALIGGLVGGLALRFRPASTGTPIMVIALFIGLVVFSRMNQVWMLAVAPYILCSFASSCFGSHLRWRARQARHERPTKNVGGNGG